MCSHVFNWVLGSLRLWSFLCSFQSPENTTTLPVCSVFHLFMAPALFSQHGNCILFSGLFSLTSVFLCLPPLIFLCPSALSPRCSSPLSPSDHFHLLLLLLPPLLLFSLIFSYLSLYPSPTPPSCFSLVRLTRLITSPPPTLHPGRTTPSPTSSPARVHPPWPVIWSP